MATDNVGHVEATHLRSDTTTIVVSPLSVTAGPDQSVAEGDTVSLPGASYASNEPAGQLDLEIAWGDGATEKGVLVAGANGGTVANTHQYSHTGNFTVTLTLKDNSGTTVSDHLHVTTTDASLTIAALAPPAPIEGVSTGTVVVATFNDANKTPDINDFTATIAWGDGNTSTATAANGGIAANADGTFSVAGSNTFAETATGLNFKVTVSDTGGASQSAFASINVADAALTDTTPVTTLSAVQGTSTGTVVLATFTDANPSASLADFTPGVNWGGPVTGTPTASVQLVGRSATVSTWQVVGSATYATAGKYTVGVTVTDIDGSSAKSTNTTVVVSGPPSVTRATFSVPENSPNGTVVGTAQATTPTPGRTVSFAITAGNTSSAFAIDSTTGKVTVNNVAALDFETNPTFNLTVTASDVQNGLSGAATITVNLGDVATQLVSAVIQRGQTQRSFIRYIDLYFSDDDGLAAYVAGQGIQLVRYDVNGLNPTNVSLAGLVNVSGIHVTIDFGINGIGGNRLTSAGDGTYRLNLNLHGQQSTTTVQFTRLFGDVNGDGVVDAADFSLAQTYQKSGDLNGDINGDGLIDARDLMVIKLAQGRKIKAPL
jgi:hypothetical protein